MRSARAEDPVLIGVVRRVEGEVALADVPVVRAGFDQRVTTVGSACMAMSLLRRFRYTAATSGRSSGFPVSFSTSDASVTICLVDRFT